MQPVLEDESAMDAAADALLLSAKDFVESHGGVPYIVGGIDFHEISDQHFCVRIHCIGYAPPVPGTPADG
jgi:hypothetical protein